MMLYKGKISGVRTDCSLSSILFLFVFSGVFHEYRSKRCVGIEWTSASFLKDLDYTDDICLVIAIGQMISVWKDRQE